MKFDIRRILYYIYIGRLILSSFLQIIFVNSRRINLSSSGSDRRLQIDDVAVGMVLPPYEDAFCKFNRGSNPPAPSIFR